jgi:hypothetical protein
MNATDVVKKIYPVGFRDGRVYWLEMLDGTKRAYVSSTTKLGVLNKEWLPFFRGSVGNREADMRMNEAAKKGSRIHQACHIISGGRKEHDEKPGIVLFERNPYEGFVNMYDEFPAMSEENQLIVKQCRAEKIPYVILYEDEEMIQVDRFRQILEKFNPGIFAREQTMWGLEAGIYKITDRISIVIKDTGFYVTDYKSGTFSEEWYLQIASYYLALLQRRAVRPEQLKGTIIVELDAKNKAGYKLHVRTGDELAADIAAWKNASKLFDAMHPNFAPQTLVFPSVVLWKSATQIESLMPKMQEAEVNPENQVVAVGEPPTETAEKKDEKAKPVAEKKEEPKHAKKKVAKPEPERRGGKFAKKAESNQPKPIETKTNEVGDTLVNVSDQVSEPERTKPEERKPEEPSTNLFESEGVTIESLTGAIIRADNLGTLKRIKETFSANRDDFDVSETATFLAAYHAKHKQLGGQTH